MSDIRKTAIGDAVAASFVDLIQIALLEDKRRGLYVALSSGEVKRLFARKIIPHPGVVGVILERMIQSGGKTGALAIMGRSRWRQTGSSAQSSG